MDELEETTKIMATMKWRGHTLQEIASEFGISREAVRQRIKRYCDKVDLPYPVPIGDRAKHLGFLSAKAMVSRLGCSLCRLAYYRKQGIINSKRLGNRWFYNEVETVEAISSLSRHTGYFYNVSSRRGGTKAKPNKSELQLKSVLDKYFPNTYKYVGDFQVNIGGRCPDLININGKKEVIELFGSFWHTLEEVEATIVHYKQYGFSCVIIWEEELKDEEVIIRHIKDGNIYIPSYCGDTIYDYGGGRVRKPVVTLNSITKKFSQGIKI